MVRLFFFSLLALFLGSALAEQQVLSDPSGQLNKWAYEDCGLPTDVVQIESIVVSPDPPLPGHDLTVTVTGTAREPIKDGAYADVVVKLGLIKLLTKRFDVCQEARNANASIQCPVEQGKHTVSQTVALPKEIPRAKFAVHVEGYTADDEVMLCLNLIVDFQKFPFPSFW